MSPNAWFRWGRKLGHQAGGSCSTGKENDYFPCDCMRAPRQATDAPYVLRMSFRTKDELAAAKRRLSYTD